MVVGDFNLLVNPEDKNNSIINRRMLSRFRNNLNALELKELYLNGRRYTWSNERERATMEKVDNGEGGPCVLHFIMGGHVSQTLPHGDWVCDFGSLTTFAGSQC